MDEMVILEFIILPIMLLSLSTASYFLTTHVIKKRYGEIKFRMYLKNFPNMVDKTNTIVTFIITHLLILSPPILDDNFHWYYIFTPLSVVVFFVFSYNPYNMDKVNKMFDKLTDDYVRSEERNNVIDKLLK